MKPGTAPVTEPDSQIDETLICMLARELWEARGCPGSGSDVDDILLATLEIIGRQNQRIAELEEAVLVLNDTVGYSASRFRRTPPRPSNL